MDKQKQIIEEMAKDIVRGAGLGVYEKAEYLINTGYRKIPENAVVLTEEELFARDEKLHKADREYIKALEKCVNDRGAKERKETAKKFAERAKEEAFAMFMGEPIIRASKIEEIAKELEGDL